MISAIIPTHNRAPLLRRALEGLCDQTLPASEFEVVVVDDGSTDETSDICSEFVDRISLQYHWIANSGIAAAKNVGLFASRGDIACFVDDDDAADSRMLEAHVEGHGAYPDERVAILGYTSWHPDLDVTPLMEYVTEIGQHLFSYPSLQPDVMLDFTHFWGGRSSAKRRFLVEHGAFNQDFTFGYEDIELGFRLSKHGFSVVYRPDAISYMLRPLTFETFCRRSLLQGRSLWHLSQLHRDPAVQEYCRVHRLVSEGHLTSAPDPDRVRELESEVRRAGASLALLQELHPLYEAARNTYVARGIAEMAGTGSGNGRSVAEQLGPEETKAPQGKKLSHTTVCRNPVFIVGCPRSGTTVLAQSLGAHPSFWVSSESDVLFELYCESRIERAYGTAHERPSGGWLRAENVSREEFYEAVGLGMNALFSSRSSGRRWIDHTPLYTEIIDALGLMFPQAQFVHILRDGRKTVQSMLRFRGPVDDDSKRVGIGFIGGWSDNFREACRTWRVYVERALAFQRNNPGRCITVQNETLGAEGEFARLVDFLGESDHSICAEYFASHRINSSFQGDSVGDSRQFEPPNPWPTWDVGERTAFVEEAGDVLVGAGYAISSDLQVESDPRTAVTSWRDIFTGMPFSRSEPMAIIGMDIVKARAYMDKTGIGPEGEWRECQPYEPEGLPATVLAADQCVWLENDWSEIRHKLRRDYVSVVSRSPITVFRRRE